MRIWPSSKLGNISVVFTIVPLVLAMVIALAGAFQELPLSFEGEMSNNLLLSLLVLSSIAAFLIALSSGILAMLIRRERSLSVIASIIISAVALVISWSWWM